MKIITCNKNEIGINSYVLILNNHSIVIDPNNYEEIIKAIGNTKLDYILLTHEHFDHIMAVDKLRDKYTAKVIAQKYTSENIQASSKNLSKFSNIILDFMNKKVTLPIEEFSIHAADIVYENSYKLSWEGIELDFFYTPGHSKGSSCILIETFLFTGDSLFECCETDTRGIGCSKKDYQNITMPFFKSLKKETKILAGHYESFLLDDKLNAREKAIEIFKKRPKFTNCYVDFNNFLTLLDKCHFFTRNNSIFLIYEFETFYKFYYFVNDYDDLKGVDDFFVFFKKTIIMEVVTKDTIKESLYKNINFYFYKSYSRYRNQKSSKFFNIVKTAKKEHLEEIKTLITNEFDPLSDYIPNSEELITLIKNKEVFITMQEDEISGVAIYEKTFKKCYFRLSYVKPNYRDGFIGFVLASSSPRNIENFYTWIDDTNTTARKLNMSLGYNQERLKNYIYKYRKKNER